MKRTPQYRLPFFQGGDIYSAQLDAERMIVIDNQLTDISSIVGDGVLSGWTVCHSGLDQIEVFPGVGFIDGIVNKTLSIKKATVLDNVQTFVYMQSQMINPVGGLNLETESTASNLGIATFVDTNPPAVPTGFVAVAADFNLINLFWNANGDANFDHYEIFRATALIGPYTLIASPTVNGVSPSDPFQDSAGLLPATQYFYHITAVSKSGFSSLPAAANATTLPDVRLPAEVSGLTLFPSNTTMSVLWNASVTTGVVYRLTRETLRLDGTVDPLSLVVFDNLTDLFFQLTGLVNGKTYRVLLQSKTAFGVLSNGVTADGTPSATNSPLDPVLPPSGAVTSNPHSITIAWLASPSPTGVAVGQKKQYQIRVGLNGIESAPINSIGLGLTKTVVSYNDVAAIGFGPTHTLLDQTAYTFRITTLDALGNESAGLVVKGETLDISPPTDPRNLLLVAGDTVATATWTHSASTRVIGYVINIDTGLGFGADIDIGYLTKYALTGLTNGVLVKIKVRAKKSNGFISSPGSLAAALPTLDTVPPAIPSGFRATGEDGQVVLSWNANAEPDFDHYIVKRSAVAQNLLAIPGDNLTVITELPKSLTIGRMTTVVSTSSFTSDDLINYPSLVGDVIVMVNGSAANQKATIASFNPVNGLVVLSSAFTTLPRVGDTFSVKLTDPSLGTSIRNVGKSNQILDIELLNGQTYAYSVQAVDLRGNASLFSGVVLVSPNCGLNDLNGPTNLIATFSLGSITLTWDQIVPTPDHPANNATAFNIYRSTAQFSGFTLIDSVPPDVLTYTDSNLINGTTYYYIVTAVRDNAQLLVDTGVIQPPNTVLLATVKITALTPLGCQITAIQNQQRIVAQLNATIADETNSRLLAHKHRTGPINDIVVTAVSILGTIDASLLAAFDFTNTALQLSATAQQYYTNLITDRTTGKTISYDVGTVFAISPSTVVSDLPYVGDFQVIINGSKPTTEFSIDPDRNVIVFPAAVKTTDVVALDGTGLSYYVPAKIDLNFRGFDIFVDGVAGFPSVDQPLQTLRFVQAVAATSIVTVQIDPVIPDFGNQDGARKVSLSPNIVLSDFTTQNGTLFVSTSGAFDSTDTFFVLVDGVRTTQQHSVDTTQKTITFDAAIDSASVVSLEILNREEVQGILPNDRFAPVDGAAFTTGIFIKPQLPPLSHEGRINEPCLPVFQTLTTTDKYVYQAGTGILGSATTPYSIYTPSDGSLLLGTSGGLLKASGFAAFTGEGEDAQIAVNYNVSPPSGLKFSSATPDTIVQSAKAAAATSGIFNGTVTITELIGSQPQPVAQISSPNMLFLQDGTILISGGAIFNTVHDFDQEVISAWIYDPNTQLMTQTGSLNTARRGHAGCLLPNGNVLICGGSQFSVVHFNQQDFTPDVFDISRIASTEIYDTVLKQWFPSGDMVVTRDFHSVVLLNDGEILVAGGTSGVTQFNGLLNPPVTSPVAHPQQTAELYNIGLGTWRLTAQLNRTRVDASMKVDKGVAIITGGGNDGRELYTRTPELWTYDGSQTQQAQQNLLNKAFGVNSIDGPVKQFMTDTLGFILAVSRNSIYASQDGETWVKTKGLDAVGVVHRIAQAGDGTLFAATDLGVYEITPDIHAQLTWFQGGLIGQGTTETFDLEPFGAAMLAGTEIGIFSSTDDGNTWNQLIALQDVFNIKSVSAIIFATSGQDLWRSDDSGATWSKVTTLKFLDDDSKLVPRAPLDLFFATSQGLYATRDGVSFFLVDFGINRHQATNNVQMAQVIGSDLVVGFDNLLMSVGPALESIVLGEFVGVVPTVKVNAVEARNGFRYDTKNNVAIFERKRLVNDVVTASANYGLYEPINGPWYRQHPNAAVIVYVNGVTQDDLGLTLDPRLGQITFAVNLKKTDSVTVSIAMTTLKDAGEFYHNEIEDKMEKEKGLPLSLGRDYAGGILQMGISVEHNFQERGIERNQYYCSQSSLVDRGFTSFMQNAEFYIMGRRAFDRFNSTIDYRLESDQESIGTRSLVPLSALEVSPNLWIGTENGIFVLDPTASIPFSVAQTIQIGETNPVRSLAFFQGDVWLATGNGLYQQVSPGMFNKNEGNGLPSSLLVFSSINNVITLGTNDAIYYSDGQNQNPPYSIWFRSDFIDPKTNQALPVTGPCHVIVSDSGVSYAGIENSLYLSTDGKTWSHVFDFDATKGYKITSLAVFAQKLYVGTNQGVFNDGSTARSDSPAFKLEQTETTTDASASLSVNDMFTYNDGTVTSLYVVGDTENVYRLVDEQWTRTAVPGSIAIQKFIVVSGPRQVAVASDTVFVQ